MLNSFIVKLASFCLLARIAYWKIIYKYFRQKYSIPATFQFNGYDICLYGDGDIQLGEISYIGDQSKVHASKGFYVSVGKGCHISSNVRITTDTAIADCDFSSKPVPSKQGNIIIGDYCWIGANVVINPGVVVGENSVVGANSVVSKNIPPYEIWGGVPARFIRKKDLITIN